MVVRTAMHFLTLSYARQTLWRYATGANGTSVLYENRTAADSLAVDGTINQLLERFLTLGKWRGDTVRARFRVYDNTITLPSTLEAVLGATPIRDTDAEEDGVGVDPFAIYSIYHEFLTSGPGNPANYCNRSLIDLGDGFPTFIDPVGTFYLKAVSTTAETAKTILFKGLDANSTQIYTAGVEGESVDLTTTPGDTTTQSFIALSSWTKSAATTGVVRVYAVDATTGEENLLVIIPPGKTTSGYHRYRVPDGDWGDTIECLCKRAFVPAVADNDPIIPGNLGALKLGMMSLQFEDRNDPKNAALYMGPNNPEEHAGAFWGAIDLLNADLDQFRGDSVVPAVQFIPGYGGAGIPQTM
jgi:hypothetical protein